MLDRPSLVQYARESIARGSKSFALASRLFDRETRERVWLLYAWCRKCDDLADGQDHGGAMALVDDPQARLAMVRDLTAKAFTGEATADPAFDALGVVARECGLTPKMADDVIEGFALDAADWHPRSEGDLYRYCYHVAGAVGVMMAAVMGVKADDDETLDRACDLGLAFQLANIARDIEEDDAAGRCYIPDDWQALLDIGPGEHMRPHNRKKLALIGRWLADEAGQYEASARVGAARLPFRARWAVLSAAGIYGDIARKVRAAGEHAWDQRIHTSKFEKLKWVSRAFRQALLSPRYERRDGLWNRPTSTPPKTRLEMIKCDIEQLLVSYGVSRPIDRSAEFMKGLGLDDEDWALDLVPDIEKMFSVNLEELLDTGERFKPAIIQKLKGEKGTPIWCDTTINELAEFIARKSVR